jgi:hypothetical protein
MVKKSSTFLEPPEFRTILVGPHIQSFFDYWDGLRGARAMPERSDVDPLDVPRPLLPNLYILVRDDDGGFRFRLGGTRLVEIFGRDITGKRIEDVLRDEVLANARRSYERVIERGKPSHSRALYCPESGGTPFVYQRLTLPLGSGTETTHLLGAVYLYREGQLYETYSDVEARELVTPSERVDTMMA